MNVLESAGRRFARPRALWGLYAAVVLIAVAGLSFLTRHAIHLSEQRQEILNRESIQQTTRVALWRLDSRLGPFIATVNDPTASRFTTESDQFVRARFQIQRQPLRPKGSPEYSFADVTPGAQDSATDSFQLLKANIPVGQLVSAVDELIPAGEPISQALVQSYRGQVDEVDPASQRGLVARNMVVQQQVAMNQFDPQPLVPPDTATSEPIADPGSDSGRDTNLMVVWIDDQLVVVRARRDRGATDLEGAWLDWESLQTSLEAEISDLLPNGSLVPVHDDDVIDPEVTLAALPARIESSTPAQASTAWSPTHTSMAVAWILLLLAAVIAALALGRLVALSERRAAFVSAVTHELRTPLTTFRLYSELLARDMVRDPADQKEYLHTLRREADRLTHLIDNVLRYSKLERAPKQLAQEQINLFDWIERITPRLSERLSQGGMTLQVEPHTDGDWKTDPPAMEQVLFNLIDNAVKYVSDASDRRVHLEYGIENRCVVLSVRDHGDGVPSSLHKKIFEPFSKSAEEAAETAAGVGLGLALARQTAEAHGGSLYYVPAPDGGACFVLSVPQGDITAS